MCSSCCLLSRRSPIKHRLWLTGMYTTHTCFSPDRPAPVNTAQRQSANIHQSDCQCICKRKATHRKVGQSQTKPETPYRSQACNEKRLVQLKSLDISDRLEINTLSNVTYVHVSLIYMFSLHFYCHVVYSVLLSCCSIWCFRHAKRV